MSFSLLRVPWGVSLGESPIHVWMSAGGATSVVPFLEALSLETQPTAIGGGWMVARGCLAVVELLAANHGA